MIKDLDKDAQRYQNAQKLLDPQFVHDLQKLSKNLNDSQKNFITKKKALNRFRVEFLVNRDKLENCHSKQASINGDLSVNLSSLREIEKSIKNHQNMLKDYQQQKTDQSSNYSQEE